MSALAPPPDLSRGAGGSGGDVIAKRPSRILIIDDDTELNQLLGSYLAQFELEVITAETPDDGLRQLTAQNPDLVVLDVMLPGRSGFEVCREIRRGSTIPIIMLTARGELTDRVVGLELGADDYLPKPYEPRELVARIQAVLRRYQVKSSEHGSPRGPHRLVSGELRLELTQANAFVGGRDLELTAAEFALLRFMMENPGQTLSRDLILKEVRGIQWDSLDRTIDIAVSRLRHKLRDDTKSPRYLKTMWGEGYRFVGEVKNE